MVELGAGVDEDFEGRGVPVRIAASAAFMIVVLIHLVGQIFASSSIVTEGSQVLLMPVLAAVLWTGTTSPRGRLVVMAFVALFFSWVGDTLPRFLDGETGFAAMIAGFLIAQVFYVVAFWPYRHQSILRQPLLVIPYAVAAAILVAICFDGAGELAVPVILYALVIAAMAVLATGLGPVATMGGIIFIISDALIALRAFAGFELPGHSFWVMLTYILGQSLLISAVEAKVAVEPNPSPR